MATAYKSNKVANNAPARAAIPGLNAVSEVFTFPAAAVVNDTIEMFVLPKGAVLCEMILDVDDLDSATAMMLQVGDATTADKYLTANALAQTGGVLRCIDKKGVIGVPLAADTKLVIKVSTAPTTGVVGDVRLTAVYNLEK